MNNLPKFRLTPTTAERLLTLVSDYHDATVDIGLAHPGDVLAAVKAETAAYRALVRAVHDLTDWSVTASDGGDR